MEDKYLIEDKDDLSEAEMNPNEPQEEELNNNQDQEQKDAQSQDAPDQ